MNRDRDRMTSCHLDQAVPEANQPDFSYMIQDSCLNQFDTNLSLSANRRAPKDKETFRNAVCDDSKVPRTKFGEFQRKSLTPQDSRGSRAGKHYKTEHFYMKREHSQDQGEEGAVKKIPSNSCLMHPAEFHTVDAKNI